MDNLPWFTKGITALFRIDFMAFSIGFHSLYSRQIALFSAVPAK
jgi:hypothetical protein